VNPTQERLLRLLSYSPALAEEFHPNWTNSEWEAIVTEADRHTLVPMLYHRMLRRSSAMQVPPTIKENLKRGHQFCMVKNFARFRVLAPVLAGLSQAGIPVIVLKGAYLASAVYDNMALRPMRDVDLLLYREDMLGADPILVKAGLQRKELKASPTRGLNEFHYREPSGQLRIETHWELYAPDYPFCFDLDALWRDAIPVTVAGAEVKAFAPEDQLIHLASHAATHRFEFGLRTLVDLAEVVAHLRINWSLLVEKAGRQCVGRAVGLPLALAGELLQGGIPAKVIDSLGVAAMPKALFVEARETMLLNVRGMRENGEPNPNLVLFFGRRKWKDRFALARNRIFPSRQTLTLKYPVAADSPWIWLYYPCMFFSILRRNLLGLRIMLWRKVCRSAGRGQAGELMDWLFK
jgi:hypothetical protein